MPLAQELCPGPTAGQQLSQEEDDDGSDSALQLALGIGDLVAPRGDQWGARDATTAAIGKRKVKQRKSRKRRGEGEVAGLGTEKVGFRNHLMSSLSMYKTTLN